VPSFPKLSETFIVSKFLGLLENGEDVNIICDSSDSTQWANFPQLAHRPDSHSRVHVRWPHRPRWLAALLFPFALTHCLFLSLRSTWFYLVQGWSLFGVQVFRHLYLDADLIILQPRVVHFEFGTLAVERTYIKELIGCKIVISFRGYDLNYVGLDNPHYYREIWRHADALHLLGEDLWRRAKDRGCPEDKLHAMIPPAIDPQYFRPMNRNIVSIPRSQSGEFHILSVGRVEWTKGYEFALSAVKLLHDMGIRCRYDIIGDGSYLEAVAFARHQLGLEGVVELLGACSPNKVRERLDWADVFLHAAVSEGFSNAVLEAQAMGLPVVCTDAGGLPENVADGVTGFVVPRRDPGAFADRLAILAQDAELRACMGLAGRVRVENYIHIEDQIAAFQRLYESVLGAS